MGVVNPMSKRKRGTGKDWEERVEPENLGIERGDIPKGGDARVLVEVWNIRAWVFWIIWEDSALDFLRE